MSKKSHFRGTSENQRGKRAQALLKSASQHLYQIHWLLPGDVSRKKSLLLTWQILGLFLNTLLADEKYLVLQRNNLTIASEMQISQKQKTFSQFFAPVLKSILKFERFGKKDEPLSFSIFEITDSENVVRSMPTKSRFRGPFEKQHGKRAQAQLKSASYHLYHIHWSLPGQLSRKKSLLLASIILGLLFNTLAADEMYPVLNRDNLTIPIQMQLSQKQKTFSNFFAAFMKMRLNFEHFEGKDGPHSFCVSQSTVSENVVT